MAQYELSEGERAALHHASSRATPLFDTVLKNALNALNAPVEPAPCAECERLKGILRERTSQMAERQTVLEARQSENDEFLVVNEHLRTQLAVR